MVWWSTGLTLCHLTKENKEKRKCFKDISSDWRWCLWDLTRWLTIFDCEKNGIGTGSKLLRKLDIETVWCADWRSVGKDRYWQNRGRSMVKKHYRKLLFYRWNGWITISQNKLPLLRSSKENKKV